MSDRSTNEPDVASVEGHPPKPFSDQLTSQTDVVMVHEHASAAQDLMSCPAAGNITLVASSEGPETQTVIPNREFDGEQAAAVSSATSETLETVSLQVLQEIAGKPNPPVASSEGLATETDVHIPRNPSDYRLPRLVDDTSDNDDEEEQESEETTDAEATAPQKPRSRSHFLNRSYSRSPSEDDYPVKKPRNSDPSVDPDAIAKMVENQSIEHGSAPPGLPPPGLVSVDEAGLRNVRERRVRSHEAFVTHPWAHLLECKLSPLVCPHYTADLPEHHFPRMTAAGYSQLINGVFYNHNLQNPTAANVLPILEAVGPAAIEVFRTNFFIHNILRMREMGEPIPQVPLVDLAQGDELTATVEGLVLDGTTYPVLYRVKSFFSNTARLESVNIELPFPDRLDLLVVSLDPYAINIATGKRGFDPNKLIIGDLIWVYSLAPTVSFATSKTNPPCSVEEAQAVQSSTVWKVHRFALIYRTLYDTMGYVTNMTATRNPTMQLCMQGHRRLVYATKSRAADPEEFRTIQPNSLICAPFRPPQLQYMVFCCNYSSAEGAQRELMSHVADIPFFPPPPPVPFGIRKVSDDFQRMVENKIHGFDMFQTNPGAVLHFLETIYSVAGGTIAACIRESTDPVVHSTFWTTQDANRCPAIVNFRIPQGKKSGWSSGRLIQGAYGPHIFCGTILRIETEGEQVIVTAQLQVSDTVRWREHLRQSRWHGLVVGTALQAADDRATPTLAMLESSVLSTSVSRNSKGWQSMQAILAGGIQLLGENREDRSRITANFQGEEVQLNVDQVRAVNMFHKRFPIAVIDSAYGAGKTVCTAVMAKEAAEQDKQVLLSTVQNSALDVIAAKMMQLSSERVRPVRFVADRLAHDLERTCEIDLPHLLENFHLTHADQLSEEEVDKFEKFAAARAELRRFAFSGTDPLTMSAEHKSLLVLDYGVSKRIYKLIRIFMRCYKPNVFLATVSSALNLTMRKGLWRKASKQWDTILVDEASMVPEATIVTMLSRFGDACFTLIGDSKQLPPYVGVLQIPLAVSLSSQSALTIANEHESAPVCPVRIVYRPHIEMMRLNSQLFYEGSLLCGTRASKRSNLLDHVTMPNPVVPIAFVDVPSQSVQSITRSHSNETEARAVNALARFLITHGIQATDIMVICLYRDQKMLCERILRDSGVFVATVDSAQGNERSVVIVCTTRTQFEQANITSFFTDPRRVNVALSRAKDGLFIIGAVSALSQLPLWAQIREWCHVRRLITPLDFFDPNWAPAPRP